MESLYTTGILLVLLLLVGLPYWLHIVRSRKKAESDFHKNVSAGFHEPATLHPKIDLLTCIGCASCVRVCPEDVLGIVEGRASVVHGLRCVSHSLCAEVCPVGAITMGFGKPKQGMEIPWYNEYFMTNIEGLYIVGELGGIGLIKNAFEQSKKAVEHIATLKQSGEINKNTVVAQADFDLIVVGAGPAGIGATLSAQEKNLRYQALEQDEIGGSILHYPRQKLVLTSPVSLPLYGTINVSEISKQELLGLINEIVRRFNLNILGSQKVEAIEKKNGLFHVQTNDTLFTSTNVILALGRRGSPRKLGIPGENLPKVLYRLIEAETYHHKHILIVGGGDSAIEAAVALANQKKNIVTLSYRKSAFVRLKEKNEKNIAGLMKSGIVNVLFNSELTTILPDTVLLTINQRSTELRNDDVFIFAGGNTPSEFLSKIGVKLRSEDV